MKLSDAMRRLELELGAVVNLEVLHPGFVEYPELALASDQYYHHGEFCRWAKLRPGGLKVCSENKARSKLLAACGRSFCGCCPNGIWDCAAPVLLDGYLARSPISGISVSEKNCRRSSSGGSLPNWLKSRLPEFVFTRAGLPNWSGWSWPDAGSGGLRGERNVPMRTIWNSANGLSTVHIIRNRRSPIWRRFCG